jgi:hypothetical protein
MTATVSRAKHSSDRFIFEKLPEKFPYALFCDPEGAAPCRCCPVQAPNPAIHPAALGNEQSFPFQATQQRIHRAGAEPIAVPSQFLDHAEAENRLLARVVEDVQAHETGKEFLSNSSGTSI